MKKQPFFSISSLQPRRKSSVLRSESATCHQPRAEWSGAQTLSVPLFRGKRNAPPGRYWWGLHVWIKLVNSYSLFFLSPSSPGIRKMQMGLGCAATNRSQCTRDTVDTWAKQTVFLHIQPSGPQTQNSKLLAICTENQQKTLSLQKVCVILHRIFAFLR